MLSLPPGCKASRASKNPVSKLFFWNFFDEKVPVGSWMFLKVPGGFRRFMEVSTGSLRLLEDSLRIS